MLEFMIGDIFTNAAILCAILYLVARHEADYSFSKVAIVTAITGLGAFLIQMFLFEHIGWFTIVPVFVMTTAMIMIFCWVRLWKTLLVVTLFCLFHVAIIVGIDDIKTRFFPEQEEVHATSDQHVGWVRAPGDKYAGWADARKALVKTGTLITEQGAYTAIVNGEVVDVNDTVTIHDKTRTYYWKVNAISKHDISYKQLNAQPNE